MQIQRSMVADTYEATYSGITEQDVKNLKEQPEFFSVSKGIPRPVLYGSCSFYCIYMPAYGICLYP